MLLPRSWRRIRYSSLHASASSLQRQHSPSQRQRTCITLHGWGGYQSYYEPLDKIRVQSGILNPDSLITVTCARLFLLSVSPCVFLFCFFSACFYQALHSSSSPITQPDGANSGMLPPSLHLCFLLFFPPPFPFFSPSLFPSSLHICLVLYKWVRANLGRNDLQNSW